MNRFLVIAACGVAFALLCWNATGRLAEAYPSLPQCRREPVKHDGKPVWFNPVPVIDAREGSFDVHHWGAPVRVHSPLQPPLGAQVMVYGTFHRDGSVTAIAWEEESRYPLKRLAVLIVSLMAVIACVFLFHRTFVWREGAFHPR